MWMNRGQRGPTSALPITFFVPAVQTCLTGGFVECGRLRAQVTIDGREDDEIVMERFLAVGNP
jgi:hypothetical protein